MKPKPNCYWHSFFVSVFFPGMLLLVPVIIDAQPGTLDATFGTAGKASYPGSGGASSAAIQGDGKIVVASSIEGLFALVRFQPDGTLDAAFGTDGKVTPDFQTDPWGSSATAVLIQPDGKMLAVGSSAAFLGSTYLLMARYNVDETPDASFGTGGLIKHDLSFLGPFPRTMTLQTDGKIIIGGGDGLSPYVMRFKTNGQFDSTFGTNGTAPSFYSGNADGCSVAVQPDGKIIASYSSYGDIGLVQYKTNGDFDSSFGTNGRVVKDMSGTDDRAYTIALQADGKIVVAGGFNYDFYNTDFGIARFKTNGDLDSTFGVNGRVMTDFGGDVDIAYKLRIQPDDKILAGGTGFTGIAHFGLARYKTNGNLDSTFGINGKVITEFGTVTDMLYDVQLQPDGRIVGAGTSLRDNGTGADMALARYLNDAALPINLFSFTATRQKTTIALNWQTAAEYNNSYFAIERSADGNDFARIGRVSSKGNGGLLQQYAFEDMQPLREYNFYRLKQVDVDGHYTYSKNVLVYFGAETRLRLYPNPVKETLVLDGLQENSNTTISIVDMQGRVLCSSTVKSNRYAQNIQQLPPGSYYVRIVDRGKVQSLRFIKE